MENLKRYYKGIWAVDFEFKQPPGERPTPVCMVARELLTGKLRRLWKQELERLTSAPFPVDAHNLFVAYYASAELNCFLSLGWQIPERILDLFAEFKCFTAGLQTPCGAGLLGALAYYGLDSIDAVEKDEMRDLVMNGGPYSPEQEKAILDYCQTDVDALARLLPQMAPSIDLERALLRGRYMVAVARMERRGVPIDGEAWSMLLANWQTIQGQLIERVDRDYGIYEGRTFKREKFAQWLIKNGIAWPRLDNGNLAMDDDTFKTMAACHPAVAPLRELRTTMSKMRLNDLAVGTDNRNRCMLSVFRSKTGRNQPSNSQFIFGPSCWLRSLIRPAPGHALAYIDWSQQELAISGALSCDRNMMEAYESGDFYLTFAKMAGAVPKSATKESHSDKREQFKAISLGVLYGLSGNGLARKLSVPTVVGRDLLRMHKETFQQFWRWSDSIQDEGVLTGQLQTVFGWTLHVERGVNARSLRNFPAQGNGAEMMRLACCLATEQGIGLCCPIHDALLIEAPIDEIDRAVFRTQQYMEQAGAIVLNGFKLRTEAKIVKYPDRYGDKRGTAMWDTVMAICKEVA